MHVNHDQDAPAAEAIGFDDFLRVDIRIGTIVEAEPFPEARKPAFKLKIDFGPAIGVKKSSAQIVDRYAIEELAGRQVAAVINFPPRQIDARFCRRRGRGDPLRARPPRPRRLASLLTFPALRIAATLATGNRGEGS